MAAWCTVTGLVLFGAIKLTMGLRVSEEEELEGLDVHEHGSPAYPGPFITAPSAGTGHVPMPPERKPLPAAPQEAPAPVAGLPQLPPQATGISHVMAIVRPSELDKVKLALEEIGIVGMTVSDVRGRGNQGGVREQFLGTEYLVSLLPKVRLDVMVVDEDVEAAVKAIVESSRTGEVGDG